MPITWIVMVLNAILLISCILISMMYIHTSAPIVLPYFSIFHLYALYIEPILIGYISVVYGIWTTQLRSCDWPSYVTMF